MLRRDREQSYPRYYPVPNGISAIQAVPPVASPQLLSQLGIPRECLRGLNTLKYKCPQLLLNELAKCFRACFPILLLRVLISACFVPQYPRIPPSVPQNVCVEIPSLVPGEGCEVTSQLANHLATQLHATNVHGLGAVCRFGEIVLCSLPGNWRVSTGVLS